MADYERIRKLAGGAGALLDAFGISAHEALNAIDHLNDERLAATLPLIAPSGPAPARCYTGLDIVPAVQLLAGAEVEARRQCASAGRVFGSFEGRWGGWRPSPSASGQERRLGPTLQHPPQPASHRQLSAPRVTRG